MKVKSMSGVLAAAATLACSGAQAVQFDDLFLFGDSYTDTGAYVVLTNGSTAGAYLAADLGINLVTSLEPAPGTSGVNFAESGARIAQGPTPPALQPRSLTQQVAEFQNYVQTGALTFNPASSLFFLLGGLNDHASPTQPIADATFEQVATLYGLGARYFEIALLPSLIPAFTDSANTLNPVFRQIVPQLQAMYPEATIKLSHWGMYYDDMISNPSAYGLTNTTDECFDIFSGTPNPACTNPNSYFYYYIVHPSDYVHRVVGERLYAEVASIPEPASYMLMAAGLAALLAARRRRAG